MAIHEDRAIRRRNCCAVLFALAFPTLLTVVYFILLASHPAEPQQAAYAIGKLIQFVFPAVWVIRVQRTRTSWSRPRPSDLGWGAVLGFLLLAAALGLYQVRAIHDALFSEAVVAAIRNKFAGIGMGSLPRFAAVAVFYCLVHSLLEEYYWRWFVFGQLRHLTSLPAAIALSSAGFMAHHVCIVSVFFGWFSAASIVLSLAVAIGGAIWAWFYERTQSLFGPWISHALVDAAIFIVGYDLVM